jgi:hypothetical protein
LCRNEQREREREIISELRVLRARNLLKINQKNKTYKGNIPILYIGILAYFGVFPTSWNYLRIRHLLWSHPSWLRQNCTYLKYQSPDTKTLPKYSVIITISEHSGTINETSTVLPKHQKIISKFSALLPKYPKNISKFSTILPEYSGIVSETSAGIPEYSGTSKKTSKWLPEYSGTVSETSAGLPECSGTVSETSAGLPECSGAFLCRKSHFRQEYLNLKLLNL